MLVNNCDLQLGKLLAYNTRSCVLLSGVLLLQQTGMGTFGNPSVNLPKVCQEIGLTEKRFLEDVAVLREWLRNQPHLPTVENSLVVENMLLRCKGSVELAKQAIDEFFSVRGRFPELFTGTDPCSEEMLVTRQVRKVFPLQDLTPEGYRIIFTNFPHEKDEDLVNLRDILKDLLMNLDLFLNDDISAGVIYVMDMSNVRLVHSTTLLKNFDVVQKSMFCIFKAYKTRMKAIHVTFPPPAAQGLIKLLMKVTPKKLTARCHMHTDLESVHRHITKEVLPKDYGGNQKTFLELAAEYHEQFKEHRQWFVDHEKSWLTDESKRPANSVLNNNDTFGFDGTFKKLEVD